MPTKSNRKDNWKPERLDDGSVSPQGRDISKALDKASKYRTSSSKGRNRC